MVAAFAGTDVRTNVLRPVENIESDDAGYRWGGITPALTVLKMGLLGVGVGAGGGGGGGGGGLVLDEIRAMPLLFIPSPPYSVNEVVPIVAVVSFVYVLSVSTRYT